MKKIKTLDIYFAAAIDISPGDELKAFLKEYGVNEKPSVALLYSLMDEYGDKFMHPFVELAQSNLDTERTDSLLNNAISKLSKASGKEGEEKKELTPEEKEKKNQNAKEWFSSVGSFISSIVGSGSDFLKQLNGTDAIYNSYLLSHEQAKMESERTTRTIVWVSVGAVVFMLFIFAFYKMFQKH